MSDEKSKVGDLLGIAPYGEAIKTVSEESIKGVGNFLSKICMPMADEFGSFLKDKVREWKLKNIIKIIEKSEGKLEYKGGELQLKAHPRVVMEILEGGAVQDNDNIQDMWAGLLASSCNTEANDDNIIYINILNQLTTTQAKIINYYAINSRKIVNKDGAVQTISGIVMNANDFFKIAESQDIDKISAEINCLISLQLVETGFGLASGFFNKEKTKDPEEILMVGLKLSPLALVLYIKCQGYKGTVKDFFKLEYIPGNTLAGF